MLYSYFKVILRNIKKNKVYTFINVTGLSVGIACCLLLTLYIRHECSYDRFHVNADRIYRINLIDEIEATRERHAVTIAAAAPAMVAELPEVKAFVRFSNPQKGFLTMQGETFESEGITYVDSTLFDVFSFTLLEGNPSEAFKKSNSIVLTRSLAKKIFGEEDVLGKSITYNHEDDLLVTGVIEDFPANSQLQFSALISFTTLSSKRVYLGWRGGWDYYSYILLQENTDIPGLKKKFQQLLDDRMNSYEPPEDVYSGDLEPLTDIHLYSEVSYDLDTRGSLTDVIIFSGIAIIVLILACVNFINLSTAQVAKRVKEIGVRKVVGSTRVQLIVQFLLESVVVATVSFLIAIELVSTFQYDFAALLGTNFDIWDMSGLSIVGLGFLTVLMVGVLSGSYPAFYLSSFRPVRILKGHFSGGGISGFNRSLLTFQFIISVALIICTLIIYRQLDFIRNKELGYQTENVIVIPLVSHDVRARFQLIKEKLGRLPGVLGSGASSQVPGRGFTSNGYLPEGVEDFMMFNVLDVDPDFLSTLSIDVLEGRNFSNEFISDSNAYLVNQSLAEKLGWSEAVGKFIGRNGKHEIIGVVEDFHFSTLHHPIAPLVLTLYPFEGYRYLSVRIAGANVRGTLAGIEEQWNQLFFHEPFTFRFLDENLNTLYLKEESFRQLFLLFSLIAIVIATLGLYGLVSLTLQQRIKEIGIRKVLGASISSIIMLLSRDFFTRLLLANLIAWPLAWFGMSNWLRTFSYHTDISWLSFISGALLLFTLTLITILVRSFRSVNASPVDYLRSE